MSSSVIENHSSLSLRQSCKFFCILAENSLKEFFLIEFLSWVKFLLTLIQVRGVTRNRCLLPLYLMCLQITPTLPIIFTYRN